MAKPIIFIAGPTGSGKTKLAVNLAKKFKGEVINADSRTIYREMDIATSKPTDEEMSGIPHHLFDIVNPDEDFSVADFVERADKKIQEVWARDKLPFLVGGTGLYLDALAYGFSLTGTGEDKDLREKLNDKNLDELQAELKKLDPVSATEIDLKNKRRVIRALEVTLKTGKPFSAQKEKRELGSNKLYLAIDCPRAALYERINLRIDKWLKEGLREEAQKLKEKYPTDLPSMSAIGYKEISDYLEGRLTLEQAIGIMKQRTRNYAKRQMTWLRRNRDIVWVKNLTEAEKQIESFLISPSSH